MTTRYTATGARRHRFLCVCVGSPLPPIPVPRKRVPWSPLYPKESGPLSFHSRRPSLFCRFCLISAQACLPSGASRRAKKKIRKESFLARGSSRRGWKGDFSLFFLAWGKGSFFVGPKWLEELFLITFWWRIVLISFGSEICSGLFTELVPNKIPAKNDRTKHLPFCPPVFCPISYTCQTACRKSFGENLGKTMKFPGHPKHFQISLSM